MITDDLNVVIPVGETCRAYHTPIPESVFEACFRVLAATNSILFSQSAEYSRMVAVKIASLTLKDEGKRLSEKRGDSGDSGANALLMEIRRLTNILCPTPKGWDMVPVESALEQKIISEQEWKETEAGLIFFTCPYVFRRTKETAEIFSGMLGGLATSLNCTDYLDSLPTSMKAANIKVG